MPGSSQLNHIKTRRVWFLEFLLFFKMGHYQVDVLLHLQGVIAGYLYPIRDMVITQQLISAIESPICMYVVGRSLYELTFWGIYNCCTGGGVTELVSTLVVCTKGLGTKLQKIS
jgi:hypothetical protein